jgi:hypothetical protein
MFARQLFNGESPRRNRTTVRSRGRATGPISSWPLAGLATHHHPLIQPTLSDIVTLSLGGGQGNGTTDPSAHSDLKGREVGTRSAEPPRHPLFLLRDKPEIQKQSLGHRRFSKDAMAGSISKIGGCAYVLVLD